MKKLNLIIVVVLFLSCSSNDNSDIDIDPIVGQWEYNSITYIFNDGNTRTDQFTGQLSKITFKNSGNVYGTDIDSDGQGNIISTEFSGTWMKLSDEKYTYTLNAIVNNNQVTNTITPEKLTFPDDNTMHREYLNDGNFANNNIVRFIEIASKTE